MAVSKLVGRFAQILVRSAQAHGHSINEICRVTDTTWDGLNPERGTIDPEVFGRLVKSTKRLMDDEHCGFAPSRSKPGTFSFVTDSIVREDTLGEGLGHAFRAYIFLSDELRFSLKDDGHLATLTISLRHPHADRFHFLQEWWLIVWPHFSSWLIGEEIPVHSVDFAYGPNVEPAEYANVFGGPCQFFQATTCVRFPSHYLRRKIIRTRDDVREFFLRPIPVDLIFVPDIARSWKSLVKAKIRESLLRTEALLSIEDVAREFAMSSRSLHRRLDQEGTRFGDLKGEVRRELILRWLADPAIPIGEVSLRAGFAEQNGINRVVQSWVGVSPGEYRRLLVASQARSGLPVLLTPVRPRPRQHVVLETEFGPHITTREMSGGRAGHECTVP